MTPPLLRADAPSFVPTNLVLGTKSIITTTKAKKNGTFFVGGEGGAISSSSKSSSAGASASKQRQHQQQKHRRNSKQKQQQVQRHELHRHYHNPTSKPKGHIAAAATASTPPSSEHHPPKIGSNGNNNNNNSQRKRRGRTAEQIKRQQPPVQQTPSSSMLGAGKNDGFQQHQAENSQPQQQQPQQQQQQQQNRRRTRNPKMNRQQTKRCFDAVNHQRPNHHHHHHGGNDWDLYSIKMEKDLHENLEEEEEEHHPQLEQTNLLLCMLQYHEEDAFPRLIMASAASRPASSSLVATSRTGGCALESSSEKQEEHGGDYSTSNRVEASSSSCAAGGLLWKNAHEALEWTTTTQERAGASDNSVVTATTAIDSHLWGMTAGSSSSSSAELLTILPRRRPPIVERKVSGGEAIKQKEDKKEHQEQQQQQQQAATTTLRQEHHHQQQPLKTWDMDKLRNRWWQLLRDHRLAQPATQPFANKVNDCEDDDDDSVSSEESFENVYFGRGSQQQQQPQQLQNEQEKLKIDDSYYTSSLPLHEAIRRNDEACLRAILISDSFPNTKISSNSNHNFDNGSVDIADTDTSCSSSGAVVLSPLQLAVQLDRPRLVRLLFAQSTYNDKSSNDLPLDNHQRSNGFFKPAILMAAELGHEECLQAFLSASHGPSILLTRDLDGNTVLHYCCRTESTTVSMLRLCLRAAAGCSYNYNHGNASTSSSSSSSLLAKLVLYKNNKGQTCMHVACEQSRVDLVEVILSDTNGSLTLLSKVLSVHDDRQQTPLLTAVASGCTDVVMALLMWRGNNVISSANKGGGGMPVPSLASSSSCTCPLTRAVQSRNVDMVALLLEFNDPCAGKRGYNLNRALNEAVHMVNKTSQTAETTTPISLPTPLPQRAFAQRDNDSNVDHDNEHNESDDEDVLLDIVRILVNAGANPCCSTSVVDSADSSHIASTSSSAVCIAAELGAPGMLTVLLSSYQSHLNDIRKTRRRDPILQEQPESFFAALESRENAERTSSLRDALAISLFYGWKKQSSSTPTGSCNGGDVFFECSLALYRAGAVLGRPGLERIKQTFAAFGRNAKCIKPLPTIMLPSNMGQTLYEVKYSHLLGRGDCKSNNKKPRSDDKPVVIEDSSEGHQFWSRVMQKSPWKVSAGQDCACDWIPLMEEALGRDAGTHYPPGDIRLVCNDGQGFVVHSTIVCKKSAKLAAAIHFECMKSSMAHVDEDHLLDNENVPEIEMPACTGRLCRWLLQHIYSGSIADRLPDEDASVECCHALLELMLVAEEYLCWSLVQECEMRLLAADSRSCHCCLCSRTATATTATDKSCSHNQDEVECEYYSVGPSMCITPDTALDVLAVCQYIGQSLDDTSYTLRRSEESTLPSWLVGLSSSSKWIVTKPLEALKEAAIGTILMHFQAVTESDAFRSQFVLNNDPLSHDNQEEEEAAIDQLTERQRGRILLQNTMDQLVELVVVASSAKQSTPQPQPRHQVKCLKA